jgi:predicted ATPase
VQAQDPLPSLLAFLAGRRILLILDNCEHVIDAAAALTERLYSNAPQVHLLATSRESLRTEGEHVHLLVPLHCPEDKHDLTATEAMTSPAVRLFMERASAGEAWLRAARPDAEAAGQAFLQALQHAKAQSALSLELRSGMALAQLWSQQGRGAEARDLLAGILDRFQEGHQTPDMKRAAGLLATLTHQAGAVTPFNTV